MKALKQGGSERNGRQGSVDRKRLRSRMESTLASVHISFFST